MVAEPVKVRRLTDQEEQRLQQIVRRGSTGSMRYWRAMMLLASAAWEPRAYRRIGMADRTSLGMRGSGTQSRMASSWASSAQRTRAGEKSWGSLVTASNALMPPSLASGSGVSSASSG